MLQKEVFMSEQNLEKMKAFLEKKKAQQNEKQKFSDHGKSGSAVKHQGGKQKMKTQGSNNKV